MTEKPDIKSNNQKHKPVFNKITLFRNKQKEEPKKEQPKFLPEFKVIAKIPGYDFKVGQILRQDQVELDLTKYENCLEPVEHNIIEMWDFPDGKHARHRFVRYRRGEIF